MSAYTKIEWCDHTYNPWIGCNAISPGCANCYAADWAKRYGRDFAERTRTKTWAAPLKWNAEHETFFAQHGRRQRVFCASLADVFDNQVPVEWRMDLFKLIADTPNLDWLILTKRIGNVMPMCSGDSLMFDQICERVWLGATVVNQEEADRDIPKLLATPARVRFLSMEPLLGSVDLTILNNPGPLHQRGAFINALRGGTYGIVQGTEERHRITHGPLEGIDWVIAGGESGPGARPSHPDWYRSLRDQCAAAGVPFLFKQWGNWRAAAWFDGPDADSDEGDAFVDLDRVAHQFLANDGRTWDTNGGRYMYPPLPLGHWCLMVNEGKKAAGRLLDGIEHNGFPS